jgi:hypothetical protein
MNLRTVSLLVILLLSAACAPGAAQPTPTATLNPDQPLIVYKTSGGFAGRTTSWTFYPSGKVATSDNKDLQATPDKVTGLYDQLLADGFAAQAGKMYDAGNCADCTQATLTLTIDGRPQTLTLTIEAQSTPPEALKLSTDVVDFIDANNLK